MTTTCIAPGVGSSPNFIRVPVIRLPGSLLYWLGSSTTRPVRAAIVSPSTRANRPPGCSTQTASVRYWIVVSFT
jgi:hypothetical protein